MTKPVLETIKQSGQPYVDRPVIAYMRPLAYECALSFGHKHLRPSFRIGTERVQLAWRTT